MIIIDDIEQGTPAWDALRIGNPGAHSADRIITPGGQPSKQEGKYRHELFDEIVLNRKTPTYSNSRMAEGLVNEIDSVNDYELMHNVEIQRVGICFMDEQRLFHISPDGLMPDLRKGFETKDALPHIQMERLKDHKAGGNAFLKQHFVQVQMSLYVSQYESWVLQSYCKNMPTLTIDVYPDLEFHAKLEKQLYLFVGKLQLMVKEWKEAA